MQFKESPGKVHKLPVAQVEFRVGYDAVMASEVLLASFGAGFYVFFAKEILPAFASYSYVGRKILAFSHVCTCLEEVSAYAPWHLLHLLV